MSRDAFKMKMGQIIGIVGGLLLIIGVFLPWASWQSGGLNYDVSGFATIIFGIPLLIFGIIGLIMCVLGGKGPGIVGIVFGVLALLVSLGGMAVVNMLAQWSGYTVGIVTITTGFGAYICIIGSILLIVGSAMVLSMKKAVAPPMAPPMTPPMAPPAQ